MITNDNPGSLWEALVVWCGIVGAALFVAAIWWCKFTYQKYTNKDETKH